MPSALSRPRRVVARLVTLGWKCWVCQLEVDNNLTRCPIQH